MIVLIDNYDSFTFNLFHYLGGLGADVVVHRNDKISSADVIADDPEAIVLSPGPCTPNEAGICLDLIAKATPTIPILGVCLGHQAVGNIEIFVDREFNILTGGQRGKQCALLEKNAPAPLDRLPLILVGLIEVDIEHLDGSLLL